MKRTIITFFIASLSFLFFSTLLFAQSSDPATGRPVTPGSETETDTALQRIVISNEEASISTFKQTKSFAYIKYLDSLLRQSKDLKADTFSIDKATGAGKMREKNQRPVPSRLSINFLNNGFIKMLLWALAIFFIVYILYKLFFADILFRKNSIKYKAPKPEIIEEDLNDPLAYNKLILQAASDKNHRLAVRYLYLQTLQMLSGKGLLQLSPDKTNYQYVNEISNGNYKKEFSSVTLNYEYAWYGAFDISEDVYNKLFINFRSFQQKI